MKIDAKILKAFVKKASLNGRNMAINMDFTDTGVASTIKERTGISLTSTFLKNTAFEGYEAIGEIFLKNTMMFLKYIDTFEGDIDIKMSPDVENILEVITEDREGFVILGDEIVCEEVYRSPFPEVNTTVTVKLGKKDLTRTLGDLSLLKTTHMVIEKIGDTLYLNTGIKNESDHFKNKLTIDNPEVGDVRVKIADVIIDLYSSLDGDFELSLGTDVPVVCKEETEFIDFTCVIAPLNESGV